MEKGIVENEKNWEKLRKKAISECRKLSEPGFMGLEDYGFITTSVVAFVIPRFFESSKIEIKKQY